ncbi:hypothetical protein [Pseudoteredinibacter isoporae]|uniref:Uncharacterized protein n=1 Tax=Pseudoteredinibacter isoporae TaxID=570281 RepID=A0A7X0JTD4_9GAMM|nr:hypothetical protein [Pseudoteredinibacter isoporae]MBB6521504.1 hypothetical protein [Pseudoteredinibacter isoporae]NHO87058.1 hypothetical protein [Pseudoteredinibacter isoporae]NIB22805.1 hypothetical protein [Pseudoteredinibacter isoporae]
MRESLQELGCVLVGLALIAVAYLYLHGYELESAGMFSLAGFLEAVYWIDFFRLIGH